jgi:hypothetical protein
MKDKNIVNIDFMSDFLNEIDNLSANFSAEMEFHKIDPWAGDLSEALTRLSVLSKPSVVSSSSQEQQLHDVAAADLSGFSCRAFSVSWKKF